MEIPKMGLNKVADQLRDRIAKRVGKLSDSFIDISDQHHIVTIRMDSSLRPLELSINQDIFAKLDDQNLTRLVDALITEYSLEIFRNFDKLAGDIFQFFQGIKKEMPENLIALSQDSAIRQIIADNLALTSVAGHGLRNMIVVKTNGMLTHFQVFIVDNKVKQIETFKSEISTLFLDFYLNYLMLLKQQKQVILRQLQ